MKQASTWIEVLRERAQSHPARRALTFLPDGETVGEQLSYGELEARARDIAAALQLRGARGERVLLVFSSGAEFVCAFFGCLFAGALAVPIAPPRPKTLARLRSTVENCAPHTALVGRDVWPRLAPMLPESGLAPARWLPLPLDEWERGATWHAPPVTGADLAFLQYTSGSTASPKGVCVSHANLLANHAMMSAAFDQRAECCIVSWLPLFHDMGLIGMLLQGLWGGNECVLMPPEAFLMKPVRWLEAISRWGAQASGGPNFAYELCARKITPEQRAGLDLRSWQIAFCGAEPVRAATLELFNATFAPCGFGPSVFYPCYGLAEATLFAAGGTRTLAPTVAHFEAAALERGTARLCDPNSAARALVSCGQAWMDGEVAVVHPETHALCAEGEVGEIWLRGPHIAGGYWNAPPDQNAVFAARTDTGDGPFLRTGDAGFRHGGELFLTGRFKEMLVVGGRNHYPEDIEATVEACHAAIRAGGCAAFGVEESGAETLAVVAEIERAHIATLDTRALVLAIRQGVAAGHDLRAQTVQLVLSGSLPKTSSGKLQRGLCRQKLHEGTLRLVPTTYD